LTSVTSRTSLFLLVGHPVDRSVSPQMFNAVFEKLSIDAHYATLDIPPENFQRVFPSLLDSGFSGNVTVPFKEMAQTLVDIPAEESILTGVCNVFWADAGMSLGDNTDIRGFLMGMPERFRDRIAGSSALILGAGGAARSVAFAMLNEGADRILIVNRNIVRGQELAARLSDLFPGRRIRSAGYGETGNPGEENFPFLINATSAGWIDDDPPALDPRCVEGLELFYDVIYGGATILMKKCEALGVEVVGGLEMLVQQAALSFSRWFDSDPPTGLMRDSALEALRMRGAS